MVRERRRQGERERRSRARIDELKQVLGLAPHPEGGWFVEHYRHPADASTAIYYLLPPGARSAWHRVDKDELWHHYEGAAVELHLIWPVAQATGSRYECVHLGPIGVL